MNTEDLPLNGGDNDCCLTRLGWLRSRTIIRDGRLLRNYSTRMTQNDSQFLLVGWTTNWLTYRRGSARTGYPLGRLLYRTRAALVRYSKQPRVYPVPPHRLYVNLYIYIIYTCTCKSPKCVLGLALQETHGFLAGSVLLVVLQTTSRSGNYQTAISCRTLLVIKP